MRTLVLAWGNPGRRDDGLGPELAARLEEFGENGVTVECDYQLQIEHSASLAKCDRVLFVDASRTGPEPFFCRRVVPAREPTGYTSHEMSPGALLALCGELSGTAPEAWILGVRGYDFDEFGEGLSGRARSNLDRAETYVRHFLRGGTLGPTSASDRPTAGDRKGE